MQNLKHVGQVRSSGRRCLVAYRTLPGDAFNCLIIPTESLPDSYHDALISLVESNAAQNAFEFWEVLERSTFPDGSTMLISLHAKGFLVKVATDAVEMIPNSHSSISLAELNSIIAQQRGVSVQDLAVAAPQQDKNVTEVGSINNMPASTTDQITDAVTQTAETPVLSNEDLAIKLRQDAVRLAKEVHDLLAKAEQLDPTAAAPVTQVEEVVKPAVEETIKPVAKKAPAKKGSVKEVE